jgi:hypothetical protein
MFVSSRFEHAHGYYAGRNERCEAPIGEDGSIAGTICTSELTYCKSRQGTHAG